MRECRGIHLGTIQGHHITTPHAAQHPCKPSMRRLNWTSGQAEVFTPQLMQNPVFAMAVHEVHAHEVHPRQLHAHRVYSREMHAHKVHAHEVHATRYTPRGTRHEVARP